MPTESSILSGDDQLPAGTAAATVFREAHTSSLAAGGRRRIWALRRSTDRWLVLFSVSCSQPFQLMLRLSQRDGLVDADRRNPHRPEYDQFRRTTKISASVHDTPFEGAPKLPTETSMNLNAVSTVIGTVYSRATSSVAPGRPPTRQGERARSTSRPWSDSLRSHGRFRWLLQVACPARSLNLVFWARVRRPHFRSRRNVVVSRRSCQR